MIKLNIFQKIGIANKLIAAYKEVCNQAEQNKEVVDCVQTIVTEIKKLKTFSPKVTEAWEAIVSKLK